MNLTWRRVWLSALVFWTVVGLVAASQDYLATVVEGSSTAIVPVLATSLSTWLYWALVTPPIVWLARRVRLESAGVGRFLIAHAGASLAVTAGRMAIIFAALQLSGWQPPPQFEMSTAVQLILLSRLVPDTLVYIAILGASYALDYYARFRDRELRASRLESQLADAQLAALRMQLNPHFMFNALNTVASQIRSNRGSGALRMLDSLGEMLRYALDPSGRSEVRLEEDLGFVQHYTDIESQRFGDRLRVVVNVEAGIEGALVPSLLLQPLVENAIRHGIGRGGDGGTVSISGRRDGERLCLAVCDDGAGVAEGNADLFAAGVGLANTRARLENLYGTEGSVSVAAVSPTGTEVRVDLPYREAADA